MINIECGGKSVYGQIRIKRRILVIVNASTFPDPLNDQKNRSPQNDPHHYVGDTSCIFLGGGFHFVDPLWGQGCGTSASLRLPHPEDPCRSCWNLEMVG